MFQRHTQISVIRHFNDARTRGTQAGLPPIMDLIAIIQFKRWTQLIPVPNRYFAAPRGANPQPIPPLPPAFAPALPPAFAPAPPPAIAPPAPAPAARVPAARSTSLTNPAPDAGLLARFARTPKRLGDLAPRGSTLVPKADNGTDELCLSYSLRGACHSNCSRTTAHRRLTTSEVARLNSFLTQANVE
jgi:hypothetical protein